MSTESADTPSGNGKTPGRADPSDGVSTEELWAIIQDQQDAIDRLHDRIDSLERQVDDVEFEANTVQEVAEQLESGKISGEAGAEFIQEFMEVPDHSSIIDAHATKLFLKIIREHMVSRPVTSKKVVQWFGLHDSSNPSVKAKRIMERLESNREQGFYIGDVDLDKHRGKNCIWLNRPD